MRTTAPRTFGRAVTTGMVMALAFRPGDVAHPAGPGGASPPAVADSLRAIVSPAEGPSPDDGLRRWSLEECLDTALRNNHLRPASRFAVEIAEAQQRQARAGSWPQLDLRGGWQRLDESPNFLFPASRITIQTGLSFPVPEQNVTLMDPTSVLGSLNLTWLLWDGGLRRGYREQAAGQLDMAQVEARRTDLEIVDTVRRYYWGAVLARQLRDTGQLTLARMEATLQLTETMYREGSGKVSRTDFLDNRVMVESIRSIVVGLEKNEAMARAGLANSLGMAWRESVEPADTVIPFTPVAVDPAHLVDAAYEFNPDWNRLEAGLRALDGAGRTARSGHYPRVALAGDLHQWWNDLDTGMATDENKQGWTIGLMLQMPLFDGFLASGRVAEAQARRREVEQRGLLLREGIGLMIKDVLLGLDAAGREYQAASEAMNAAAENRELNFRAYQEGLVETGDVIRAQLMEALMTAQRDRLRYDHAVLRSRLDLVVGTEVARILDNRP